ncbi:F-actin-capping protein subunit beta [Orbilia oligospora]|uniref:F-actin-capping protein subunit beta n=1 Tax=Orbilia oligospora TaxID=2813651 RepID=A0A7C8NY79_ORBOL|nr:F-actin-capping protein subunit beta [Orbilia oligospora]
MSVHPQLWRRSLRSPTTKVIAVIVTVLILLHSLPLQNSYIFSRERTVRINTIPDPPKHPIDQLIHEQRLRYKELLKRQSKSPEEAITNYKLRYNRSPPSGFADWVRIESARRAGSRLQTVSIKNGTTELAGLPIMESLKDVLQNLPDMTFLLNELDEPRVIGSQPEKDDITFRDYGRRPSWERLTASCQKTDSGELEQQQHPYFLESTKTSLDLCRNPAYHDQYGMFTSPCTFVATEGLVPVFSVARVSTMRDVLVPGHDYHNEGFLNKNDVDSRNFTSKENKLYWRGSNTGTYASPQMKWETNHRARFMLKVRNNTDLFDVGMTAYIQCDWNTCQAMEQALGLPPRADKNASFKYKFVMDMDGNGYSGRFYRLLQSNSVVFKQTLVEQWHDERVIPWVHYIPVTIGLDEIEDLVRFFSTEGARQAEEIAGESTSWVKVALRPIDMTIYEYRLLLEYAALFEKTG